MRVLVFAAVLSCQTPAPPSGGPATTEPGGPLTRSATRVPHEFEPCPPGTEPGEVQVEVGVGKPTDGKAPMVPYTGHRCRRKP
jgi:hypothetical protein